jgi:phosphotransferase system enzyme I (PtsI)
MLTGLAASSGIARGAAYIRPRGERVLIPRRSVVAAEVSAELRSLEKAMAEVEADLIELRDDTLQNLGNESAAIFEAQACLLRDPELLGAVERRCRDQEINVKAAWSDTVDTFYSAFARLGDPAMRERAADLRDVTRRHLDRLLSLTTPHKP